jgi:hypothetical protein
MGNRIPWYSWPLLASAGVLLVIDLIGEGPQWGNIGVMVLIGARVAGCGGDGQRHEWPSPGVGPRSASSDLRRNSVTISPA